MTPSSVTNSTSTSEPIAASRWLSVGYWTVRYSPKNGTV